MTDDADPYEMSPVHLAVIQDDLAELTRLLHAGHDPDHYVGQDGWTPLIRAIDGESDGARQTGDPLDAACTAVLPAYGADPAKPSREGLTPYHLAFQSGHDLAVRLLEAHMELRGTRLACQVHRRGAGQPVPPVRCARREP
ncbi:ankyrin repeat domain-containing protein [Streptomyces sp. NBC_00102]|uniref:ankyrin repeat domain-containing protein n=1 Tax=Streptomyces sp. NBC_00102 TaxID=2975652 RepID=UPI00225BF017|nr:ankyrin repeat domain-containing protein [Streptomyces sp. NBC_00102]MCX5398190.1 ankyrin repeat domain-containing protein [Streptomyces sp. NBC_00102]